MVTGDTAVRGERSGVMSGEELELALEVQPYLWWGRE